MFATSGFAGTRTDSISAEAGVNKALLYYYFKSKEQLYAAVLEEQFQAFNEKAIRILTAPGRPRELLLRFLGLQFDAISMRPGFARMHLQMLMGADKPFIDLVQKHAGPRNQAFIRLLERGVREGEFRRADAMHTAISISGLIVFYFGLAPILEIVGHRKVYSRASLRKRKNEVLDFVRFGLFTDPTPFPL
jgi:AcrR family transcriptional regulator